jgi:hypothetical protein
VAHYCGHSRQKANSCDRNRNGKPHDFRTSGRGLGVCPLVGTVATWENPLPGNIPRFLRPSDHAACAVAYRVRFSRLLRQRLALASSVDHHFSRGSVNCVHYRFRTAIGGRIETSRSTQIAPTTRILITMESIESLRGSLQCVDPLYLNRSPHNNSARYKHQYCPGEAFLCHQ